MMTHIFIVNAEFVSPRMLVLKKHKHDKEVFFYGFKEETKDAYILWQKDETVYVPKDKGLSGYICKRFSGDVLLKIFWIIPCEKITYGINYITFDIGEKKHVYKFIKRVKNKYDCKNHSLKKMKKYFKIVNHSSGKKIYVQRRNEVYSIVKID